MLISVIIVTKDRPLKFERCLASIINNKERFEILVVDQNTESSTRNIVQKYNHVTSNPIKLINSPKKSLSYGHNTALHFAKGDVIVFTDDDCIVSKNWISIVKNTFQQNPKIVSVFGKSLPWKPKDHIGYVCPCTFTKRFSLILTAPCIHHLHIGYGNNMAIRKKVFQLHGLFKTWLGPGSIGSNAEDAEMAMRILVNKYQILYNPKMIVWHDKWLLPNQMVKQQSSYSCGEAACYSYFLLKGHAFALKIVYRLFNHSYVKLKQATYSIFSDRTNGFMQLKHEIVFLLYKIRGLTVGIIFSIFD